MQMAVKGLNDRISHVGLVPTLPVNGSVPIIPMVATDSFRQHLRLAVLRKALEDISTMCCLSDYFPRTETRTPAFHALLYISW